MKSLFLLLASAAAIAASSSSAADGSVPHAPAARAANSATAYKVVDIPFKKFVLPNGLTLIVHEDHNRPVASVGVWYHVGSQNEVQGRTGFAHLFEHLMFNGSEHADDDWFKFMSPLGATNLNGTTAADRTNFFETVPVGALDRVLWLESDRMGHLLGAVTQAKLDEQRGVVQNEKRQAENSPFGAIPETISASVYPVGHPYSWETIGSLEDLNAATLEDVKAWFRKWYGAGNATIVISGDVDANAMRDKVQKYFGFVPQGPALKRNDKWIAKRTGERRARIQVPAPQAPLIQVWNVAGYGTPDTSLLDIAAQVFGGGPNSRLHRRLVIQDAIASEVGANNVGQELGGLFTISATPKPGVDPLRVERVIGEELARFLRDGPTVEEVDRFKALAYGQSVRTAENPDWKGLLLAENFLYTGDPVSYRVALEQQYAATAADVRRAAQTWLSDGVFTLTATPLSSATVIADVDRKTQPPVGGAPGLMLAAPHAFALSNGLKVALVERHSAPTLAMQLIFRSGAEADGTAVPPRTGELATALATKGTCTRSESDITLAQERLSLGLGWSASPETLRYTFSGLTTSLATSLDLFADVLINPSFPAPVFERDRALAIDALEQQRSSPRGKIALVDDLLLYGPGHPYSVVATRASLSALKVSGLAAWYHRWVRPDNATLLVVGDVTQAQLRPMLEARLAAWRVPPVPLPTPAALPAVKAMAQPRVYLIDQPGAEQSVIKLSGFAPLRADPAYEAIDLASDVLGGGFLGRLNLNLREDKHWSYGAYSSYNAQTRTGVFGVSTSVQTDKTADALKEINREVREVVTTRKPSEAEVLRVKNDAVLTMTSGLGSANGTAGYYSQVIRYGLGWDYWNGRAARTQALTPEQIAAAAVRLVQPDTLNWIVVGDLSRIEADVRRLDIGVVSVIDTDGRVVR